MIVLFYEGRRLLRLVEIPGFDVDRYVLHAKIGGQKGIVGEVGDVMPFADSLFAIDENVEIVRNPIKSPQGDFSGKRRRVLLLSDP